MPLRNDIKIKGIIINQTSKNPTLSEKNFTRELKNFYDIPILAEIEEMKNLTKEEIIAQFEKIEL